MFTLISRFIAHFTKNEKGLYPAESDFFSGFVFAILYSVVVCIGIATLYVFGIALEISLSLILVMGISLTFTMGVVYGTGTFLGIITGWLPVFFLGWIISVWGVPHSIGFLVVIVLGSEILFISRWKKWLSLLHRI